MTGLEESKPGAPGSSLPGGRLRYVHQFENLLGGLILGAMIGLPLTEILLRFVFKTGIQGATSLVQHLTLILGMAGGALAAREGRLLSLSTPTSFLPGKWRVAANLFAGIVATAVSGLLAHASWQYVSAMKGLGKSLAYGIPLWAVQMILPAGFTLIGLRLAWRSADDPKKRAVAFLAASGLIWFFLQPPIPPGNLMVLGLLVLLVATILGAPIFVTLGGAALILFWGHGEPTASIPLKHYSLVTNPTLPSVPLFTLVGYLLVLQ